MSDLSELTHLDATALADLVRRKDVQPIELVGAVVHHRDRRPRRVDRFENDPSSRPVDADETGSEWTDDVERGRVDGHDVDTQRSQRMHVLRCGCAVPVGDAEPATPDDQRRWRTRVH